MAQQKDNTLQKRLFSARIRDEHSGNPSDVRLPTFSANDDIIVIDPITPPLSSLSAVDKEQLVTPKPVTAGKHGVTSATSLDHIVPGMNKDPLGVSGAIPSWIIRTAPHECSLCNEVFSTVKMLNKHLLTHRQDRQHVCPVCQRSFKCHDHLNVHLVTHQKKNLFQSTTPGLQRCCFDGHSLHHHQCSSHHGGCLIPTSSRTVSCNPIDPVQAQWKACSVAGDPHLGGSADYIDCCSIFPVPPKPTSETQYMVRNCGTFKKEPSYLGFSSVGGLGVRSFPSQALDPWLQGDGKSPSDDHEHEPHPHQRTFCGLQHLHSLKPEPSSKSGGLSWVSPLGFPELQSHEELFSFHPYKEVVNSGEDLTVEIASWEPKQSQSSVPVKKELEPHLFTIFKDSTPFTPLEPITASNPIPSHSSEAHLVQQNSILSSRSLVSFPSAMVHLQLPAFQPPRTDSKKTMIRKNNIKGSDLLTPLHPRKCLASQHLQPCSPSQFSLSSVAVASFTADINAGLNSGRLSELRYSHTSGGEDDLQEASDSLAGPPSDSITACTKDDHLFLLGATQMQRLGAPSGEALKMPCVVEQNPRMPLVSPVSVPFSDGTRAALEKEDGEPQTPSSVPAEEAQDSAGSSKKTHHIKFLKTLFIPNPMTPKTSTHLDRPEESGQWCQAAGGYPSQLCSPVYPEHHLSNPSFKAPPYTPPPMLSPLQLGTGLYLSTLPSPHHHPPLPSTQTTPWDAAESISLAMDKTVVTIEPRINVGPQFQAEIPALQNVGRVIYDEHPAQLVWAPWGDLASNPQTQQQVEELLKLCCSSVVPGGGANTELALHCLHEVQGDVLAALELLLIKGDYRSASHPMLDYHYSGSVQWSPQEKRAFGRALMAHGKDFQLIQRMGKSVAQCVEYYYAIKKVKHLKQRSKREKKKGGVADSGVRDG